MPVLINETVLFLISSTNAKVIKKIKIKNYDNRNIIKFPGSFMGDTVTISYKFGSSLHNYLFDILPVYNKEKFYVPSLPDGYNAVFDLYTS